MDDVKQELVSQARTLRRELEALEARISAIESDEQVSRRGLFRKLGAAAAGGVALAVGSSALVPGTAHAGTDGDLVLGVLNTAEGDTTLSAKTPFDYAALSVYNDTVGAAIYAEGGTNGSGLEARGHGDAPAVFAKAYGTAISAVSDAGTAVQGTGDEGGHGLLGFASGGGNAVFGVKDEGDGDAVVGLAKGTGRGVFAVVDNPASATAALESISNANSWALRVLSQHTTTTKPATEIINYGKGSTLYARGLTVTSASAVRASATGTGSGIYATSTSGRGGTFQGPVAAARLMPGKLATYPKAGSIGDLYVDTTGRLWFCKKTGNPATWKQIA
jgi:hypothetical protein